MWHTNIYTSKIVKLQETGKEKSSYGKRVHTWNTEVLSMHKVNLQFGF